MSSIFDPMNVGRFELDHRVVMAPLTRCRALGDVPCEAAKEYYAQRTTPGGLIIAEGTLVSRQGHGYPCTPGIYTPEQCEAWKPVTKAVKEKGGVFFLQIWHCGRASHTDYQPDGALPVSASPIAVKGQTYSVKANAMVDFETPRALEASELPEIVEQFRQAARNAIDVGFDGVEIHGANGYLLNQFMCDGMNIRNDQYGGNLENRCRFPLEVFKAVADEIGADRVGYRLSPFGGFLDAHDSDPIGTHSYMIEELIKNGPPAYIHCVEPRVAGNTERDPGESSLEPFEKICKEGKTAFIRAGGYTPESAKETVAASQGDVAIAFGRWFLSTPDLVQRIREGLELNPYDRNTFYTQDPVVGYTDYPFHSA